MWDIRPRSRMGTHTVEDPDLVDEFESDEKGRVTLGKRYANKNVKLIVDKVS